MENSGRGRGSLEERERQHVPMQVDVRKLLENHLRRSEHYGVLGLRERLCKSNTLIAYCWFGGEMNAIWFVVEYESVSFER